MCRFWDNRFLWHFLLLLFCWHFFDSFYVCWHRLLLFPFLRCASSTRAKIFSLSFCLCCYERQQYSILHWETLSSSHRNAKRKEIEKKWWQQLWRRKVRLTRKLLKKCEAKILLLLFIQNAVERISFAFALLKVNSILCNHRMSVRH